jgi:DNA-binding response OmpR family regulator
MKEIVIIDDEADILEILSYNLTKEQYKVKTFSNPLEAFEYIKVMNCDLVITDWLMPEMDGLDLCRLIRENSSTCNIPVIMISCKGDEIDVVTALEIGAEDYIVKPFRVKELIVRIKKVLKRNQLQMSLKDEMLVEIGPRSKTHSIVERNNLRIDLEDYSAYIDNRKLSLTYTEFKLLKTLAEKSGKVFTRNQIIESLNGDDCIITERAVDVQIVGLRKKLGTHRDYIKTIRSIGYKFDNN